mgnify:CR=1 FL=1
MRYPHPSRSQLTLAVLAGRGQPPRMRLAWLLLGQSIAPVQVAGALLVVGAVLALGLPRLLHGFIGAKCTRFATRLMLSASATDEPPNFCTMRLTADLLGLVSQRC